MKVSLIYGPAKCGKTRLIVKKFAEDYSKNPVIITPTSQSVSYIKELVFKETSLLGFFGYRIITFDHLVNILMEGCKELSKISKFFFIHNIVNQIELKYFLPVKPFRGFYELLSRFISELKAGEIMPEVFLKGINKKGATLKDKEIYTLYSVYQEELHKLNIYDHEGRFWQAQQLIDNGELGPLKDTNLLLVDGFQNFSPAELKIIESIGKYVDEIIITLTLDHSQENVFTPTIKTYNQLKKTFNNLHEMPIEHLGFQPKKIKILSCPGTLREIEEIAREIKELIIHSGKKPNDIAILFRDLTEYKELIIEVFDRYGIPYSISEGISLVKSPAIKNILRVFESGTNIPLKATFSEYVKILKGNGIEGLSKTLDELVSLRTHIKELDNIISLSAFYEILITIAESIEYSPETYKEGQIQVLDVHKARGLSFPVVFIGGLRERSFPKQIAEEPLYSDIERLELRRFGINVEPSKEKQTEEMFLFYNAINTAKETLYLTYPATDNEGHEELSSYYIDEINKLYPEKTQTKAVHLSYVIPEFEDVYTHEDLVIRIIYNYWNNIKDKTTEELFNHLDNPRFRNLLKNADIENNRIPPWNGIITDKKVLEKIKADFGVDYKFSVSQFNEYGTCPFNFFAKRILGIEPIEELEDEILPIDEGNLYHAILREFYQEGGDILNIAERHFKTTEETGLIKNISLWKIKKEEIIKNLNNIIQYETTKPPPLGIKRKPAYFEIPFGMGENIKPLIINDIKIRGKIDRIDLTDSGLFVVIDYKSGGYLISINEILKGTNLQLPIYIMAVKDVLDIGTEALEGYFFYVKRKKYYHANPLIHYKPTKKGLKPNPVWYECIEKTKEYVKEYAEAIRDGKFPPSPKGECPSYCDYRDICRHSITKVNPPSPLSPR